ncbi:MAG TPA: DegQ family serine endoprotease [Chlamydiales bacterium]|nr:DegQ family serine endoprotease [Chlamydiales bacterium]
MKRVTFIFILNIFGLTALGAAHPLVDSTASASLLEQTSQAFTQIAEKAMPATVFIKAETTPQMTQQEFVNPFEMFGDDFFRRFFGGQPFNQLQPRDPQPQIAGGSGFLITADGYVVTNNHVVKDASTITVTLNDGREYPAIIKGADPRTDLALLKIDETNLPCLNFGDSESLKIGEWVVAIGNPFGIGATLTAGIVSAKGRQDLGIASYEDFIQTDAAINPGNSGGPLLNLQGEVIGVNTAIFTRSGGYMGIGLSIPSQMAQTVIEQIQDTGVVKRAYLGVVLQPVDKDLANALEMDNQEGVLISEIVKGSPAEKAGLQQGDIILAMNDKLVKTVSKLRNDIALMNPGSDITLHILRNNKKIALNASLGSMDGEVITTELIQKIGIEIENFTTEMASRLGVSGLADGVVVSRVKPGSPAAQAGLKPGFLITGVAINWNNQKSIKNTDEFEESIKELGNKKHLILIVRHHNFQRYYTVKIN